jgi:hypothetical protein
MSDFSRVAYQIRHYRELAAIAKDCARKSTKRRSDYLELERQWTALADRLEESAAQALSA